MKKYRLTNPNMNGVVTGILPGGKIVILGDEDTSEVQINNRFILEILSREAHSIENTNDFFTKAQVVGLYAWVAECGIRFYSNERLLEVAGDGWPVELGLVEEIPEEPKREYMDLYEALRMVYEHGKSVVYDSEEWIERHGSMSLLAIGYLNTVNLRGVLSALDAKYNKKLWYVI